VGKKKQGSRGITGVGELRVDSEKGDVGRRRRREKNQTWGGWVWGGGVKGGRGAGGFKEWMGEILSGSLRGGGMDC